MHGRTFSLLCVPGMLRAQRPLFPSRLNSRGNLSFPRTHSPASLPELLPRLRMVHQWARKCLETVLLLAWPQQCQRRADGAPNSSPLGARPNRTGLPALRAPLESRGNTWESIWRIYKGDPDQTVSFLLSLWANWPLASSPVMILTDFWPSPPDQNHPRKSKICHLCNYSKECSLTVKVLSERTSSNISNNSSLSELTQHLREQVFWGDDNELEIFL